MPLFRSPPKPRTRRYQTTVWPIISIRGQSARDAQRVLAVTGLLQPGAGVQFPIVVKVDREYVPHSIAFYRSFSGRLYFLDVNGINYIAPEIGPFQRMMRDAGVQLRLLPSGIHNRAKAQATRHRCSDPGAGCSEYITNLARYLGDSENPGPLARDVP